MKRISKITSLLMALIMLIGIMQINVFADTASELSLTVNDFSVSENYFTSNNKTKAEVLTIGINPEKDGTYKTSGYSNILDGKNQINLLTQENPLIVSFDIESSGYMKNIQFKTDGQKELTNSYNTSLWQADETHNVTMVFRKTSVSEDGKLITYNTDLYVDDKFVENYSQTNFDMYKGGDNQAYFFREIRFYHTYTDDTADVNKCFKIHSLKVTNKCATVEKPEFTATNGFEVTDNKISFTAGKTVNDLKTADARIKVYSSTGEEVEDTELLATGMKAKVVNTYDVVDIVTIYSLANASVLNIDVSDFSVSEDYFAAKTKEKNQAIKVSIGAAEGFARILDGKDNINLFTQTNPLIVSVDVEASVNMQNVQFKTSQGLELTNKYDTSSWQADEVHNITIVFEKTALSEDGKKLTYDTDLYVDDKFVENYQKTNFDIYNGKDSQVYMFTEIRFCQTYSDDSTPYFKAHSLKITNGNTTVTKPEFVEGNGFVLNEKRIAGYTGKTIAQLKENNPTAKVYNSNGEEIKDETTPLTADMTVKVVNVYDIVNIADTYTFDDDSKTIVTKTYESRTSNYRFNHWGPVAADKKPSDGGLENGVINSGVTDYAYYSMCIVDDSTGKIADFKNATSPIVVSLDVNPWATNSTETDSSKNNVKAVGFFARHTGSSREEYNALTDMIPVSELQQNTANNLTMVYYPNVAESMDRVVLYLNGKYYSDKYITYYGARLVSEENDNPYIRLVVDKEDAAKDSTIGVTNIYAYELNKFSDLSLKSDTCTIVNNTVNGYYTYSKDDLAEALSSDDNIALDIADETAVSKGDKVNVSVDYTAVANGLRTYTREYKLGEAYGDLTAVQIIPDNDTVTVSASGSTYVKDNRLDDVTVPTKTLYLAYYNKDSLIYVASKDVNVKAADRSITADIPENADSVQGFLWDKDTLTPICENVKRTLKYNLADTITCWGDSLTQGVGSSDEATKSYPAVLASLTGKTVINEGIAGETSMTIAARQGAVDIKLTSPVTIPADRTPVAISYEAYSNDTSIGKFNPLSNKMFGWANGNIGGVNGTFTFIYGSTEADRKEVKTTYFTRSAEGESVTLPSGTKWVTPSSESNSSINIFWTGTNGDWGGTDTDSLVNLVKKQIAYTGSDKYVVVGLTTRPEADTALKNEFGDKFFDINSALISEQTLTDAGITPTEEDKAAISAGNIPTSLLSEDGLHFNDNGYNIIANKIAAQLKALGYVTE